MKKLIMTLVMAVMAAGIVGCETPTSNIDTVNDTGKAVMGLDYRDFARAASVMIESMSRSPQLSKPDGGRYVMAVSTIVNDTMQRIDTDQLTAKIEEELLNGGRVVLTSAVGKNKVDNMIHEARDLRENDEFNQNTTVAKGQLIAPDLSMAGKILQRNVKVDSKTQQIEYYFQLKVSDISSGLVIWQKEEVIGKRGSNKSVSW